MEPHSFWGGCLWDHASYRPCWRITRLNWYKRRVASSSIGSPDRFISFFEHIHNQVVVLVRLHFLLGFVVKKRAIIATIMSYLGNTSDVEQDKARVDYSLNRSNNNISTKPLTSTKFSDILWNNKREKSDESDSEISDSGNFLAKGKTHVLDGWKKDHECGSTTNGITKIYIVPVESFSENQKCHSRIVKMWYCSYRRLSPDSIPWAIHGKGSSHLWKNELQRLFQFDENSNWDFV